MTQISEINISCEDEAPESMTFFEISMPINLLSEEDKRQLIHDLTGYMFQWIDGRKSPDYVQSYPD